jgi:hypothetical protein
MSSIKERNMVSHTRMVHVAKIALQMLEELAVKTQPNETLQKIKSLKEYLDKEKIASKQDAISPERLKFYENQVDAILKGRIDASQVDIDDWWDNF